MRLYTYATDAARAVTDFGSVGLGVTPIMRAQAGVQIIAMWLAPGGAVGRHPASGDQLFLVIQGEGWVAGDDGVRHPIRAGQAAWWGDGEEHESGSESGMGALVIEGDTLDPSLLRPLPLASLTHRGAQASQNLADTDASAREHGRARVI